MGKFDEENLVEVPDDRGPVEFNREKEFRSRVEIEKRILSGEKVYSPKPSQIKDPNDKTGNKRITKIVDGKKVYPEIKSWFKDRRDGVYFKPDLSSYPLLGPKGYKLKPGEDPKKCLDDFVKSWEKGELNNQLEKWDKLRVGRNKKLSEILSKSRKKK